MSTDATAPTKATCVQEQPDSSPLTRFFFSAQSESTVQSPSDKGKGKGKATAEDVSMEGSDDDDEEEEESDEENEQTSDEEGEVGRRVLRVNSRVLTLGRTTCKRLTPEPSLAVADALAVSR